MGCKKFPLGSGTLSSPHPPDSFKTLTTVILLLLLLLPPIFTPVILVLGYLPPV